MPNWCSNNINIIGKDEIKIKNLYKLLENWTSKIAEENAWGEKVNLTRTEYDILKLLMEHPGQVYSPNEIYEKVWKDNPYGTENTVAVHIRHLREKIEYNPAEPRYLKVVWGRCWRRL